MRGLSPSPLRSVATIAVVLAGVALTAACNRGTDGAMAALRASPDADAAGPYVIFGSLIAAADFLETTYDDVEAVLRAQTTRVDTRDSVNLVGGPIMLRPADTVPTVYGDLVFENTSQDKVVLFLEPIAQTRESQGFSFVKLEPGDRFVFEHNLHPALVKVVAFFKGLGQLIGAGLTATATKVVVVVTAVIVVGEEAKAVFNDQFACNLSTKLLQPDECVGTCPGSRCLAVPGATQPYGFAWMGMAEPTACGC